MAALRFCCKSIAWEVVCTMVASDILNTKFLRLLAVRMECMHFLERAHSINTFTKRQTVSAEHSASAWIFDYNAALGVANFEAIIEVHVTATRAKDAVVALLWDRRPQAFALDRSAVPSCS